MTCRLKDKDLDALLEKLGETKDEPAPEERSRSRPQPGEPSGPSKPAPGGGRASGEKTKQKDQGLQGKDKEIDDKLEEFAGKKRKKKGGRAGGGKRPARRDHQGDAGRRAAAGQAGDR